MHKYATTKLLTLDSVKSSVRPGKKHCIIHILLGKMLEPAGAPIVRFLELKTLVSIFALRVY